MEKTLLPMNLQFFADEDGTEAPEKVTESPENEPKEPNVEELLTKLAEGQRKLNLTVHVLNRLSTNLQKRLQTRNVRTGQNFQKRKDARQKKPKNSLSFVKRQRQMQRN